MSILIKCLCCGFVSALDLKPHLKDKVEKLMQSGASVSEVVKDVLSHYPILEDRAKDEAIEIIFMYGDRSGQVYENLNTDSSNKQLN